MKYSIKELSLIANISTRTLRYYDQINLLSPSYINDSGYRIYTSNEVDILQQIMFYKELGLSLKDISKLINSNKFNNLEALNDHYQKLLMKQNKTNELLSNIKNTISNIKGEREMSDQEKFNGFKEKIIQENDKLYGEELKDKYGTEVIEDSYEKFRKLSKYEIEQQKKLEHEIKELLIKAVSLNDIYSDISMEMCAKHQKWIKSYWGSYSKEAHMALVEMYLTDERFKQYYDKTVLGGSLFLRNAMKIYLNMN